MQARYSDDGALFLMTKGHMQKKSIISHTHVHRKWYGDNEDNTTI